MSQQFSSKPPSVPSVDITFPHPHILLVTLNRPQQLNALRREMHHLLNDLWQWYDNEPTLRCAVITGKGRAFCAGADLKQWNERNNTTSGNLPGVDPEAEKRNGNGFGGLSNRRGKKPIIGAVNGLCLGGGLEMVMNLDMVIASSAAKFGLPEVARGVVAIAGALPRLPRIVGRQRASEMALLGRMYTAEEMLGWGIVNKVVPANTTNAAQPAGRGEAVAEARRGAVVEEALRWAEEVANNSPDSVIVSREGLLGAWEPEDPRASTRRVDEGIFQKMQKGDNMKEGVVSFVEKRKPKWKNSKL